MTDEKITLKDVYEVVSRMEAKLDKRIDDLEVDTLKRLDNHSGRIASLEQWRVYILGALALAIALFTFFGTEIKRTIFGQ